MSTVLPRKRFGRRPPGTVAQALKAHRLGTIGVMSFQGSAAAQFTVIAGVVAVAYGQTGLTGIPAAFLVVGAVLWLFSVGYVAMGLRIAHVANTGALYAYLRYLGRPTGVVGGWVSGVAYTFLYVGLYGILGAVGALVLEQWFGIEARWWGVAFVALVLVGILGVLQLDLAAKLLGVLLGVEVLTILVFGAFSAGSPAEGRLSFDALLPDNLLVAGAGSVIVIAILGCIGFEMGVVFGVSAADPTRTVRRATYAAVVCITLLYAFGAWAMGIDVGFERIVAASKEQQADLVFNLAGSHLGAGAVKVGYAVLVTSVLAGLISFHNVVARYTRAMAAQGVLPFPWLAKVANRSAAPWAASVTHSAFAFVVILVYAIYGWDPVVQLFYWWGTAGGLGVLFLIVAASVAVPVYMARHRDEENVWQAFIAPVVSALLLLGIGYLAVRDLPTLFGVAPDHPLVRTVQAIYLLAVGFGLLRSAYLRARKPMVYQQIGSDVAVAEVIR